MTESKTYASPWTPLVVVAIVLWGAAGFLLLRPHVAVTDLQGWRQSDTQQIALNMLRPDTNLFYPAIAWGGDGPGYVETELQLYTTFVAGVMRVFGPSEWAGQLVSSIAMVGAALIVFFDLKRRYGTLAGSLGVCGFLSSRAIVHGATSIQPDAVSLLGYVGAWALFQRYRAWGRTADLAGYGVVLALAMLTKPTAAQLGLSCALLLLFADRDILKRRGIWLAWAGALGVLALYLWHAHGIYERYGNSFGIFKGGNDKVPTIRELTSPVLVYRTLRLMFVWGIGLAGTLALFLLAVRRKLTPEIAALLVGNVLLTVFTIRITATMAGTHYVAPAALIAAEAVAVLGTDLAGLAATQGERVAQLALVALGLFLGLQVALVARFRRVMYAVDPEAQLVYATALALKPLVHPNDLIVVRAKLYDPRIFYVTGTRGWLVSRDNPAPEMDKLETYAERGARYFADATPAPEPNPVSDWLHRHAHRVQVKDRSAGPIWIFDDALPARAGHASKATSGGI